MYCLPCHCVYRRILENQTKGVSREEMAWPWRTMTFTHLGKPVMLISLQTTADQLTQVIKISFQFTECCLKRLSSEKSERGEVSVICILAVEEALIFLWPPKGVLDNLVRFYFKYIICLISWPALFLARQALLWWCCSVSPHWVQCCHNWQKQCPERCCEGESVNVLE